MATHLKHLTDDPLKDYRLELRLLATRVDKLRKIGQHSDPSRPAVEKKLQTIINNQLHKLISLWQAFPITWEILNYDLNNHQFWKELFPEEKRRSFVRNYIKTQLQEFFIQPVELPDFTLKSDAKPTKFCRKLGQKLNLHSPKPYWSAPPWKPSPKGKNTKASTHFTRESLMALVRITQEEIGKNAQNKHTWKQKQAAEELLNLIRYINSLGPENISRKIENYINLY